MRFSWTRESFGFALRDSAGLAHATMVRNGEGFWVQIITRNMPDSGPYKGQREAAAWVAKMMLRWELAAKDSEFELPVVPLAKRQAA